MRGLKKTKDKETTEMMKESQEALAPEAVLKKDEKLSAQTKGLTQEALASESTFSQGQRIPKSRLQAKTGYDYQKLCFSHLYFVPCSIVEQGEQLLIRYQEEGLQSFNELIKKPKLRRLELLIQVAHLEELTNEYAFALSPANLFLNSYGQVKLKERDIQVDSVARESTFLVEYQALIGSLLIEKYRYEDILQGGLSLLKESGELKDLAQMESVSAVRDFLIALHQRIARAEAGSGIRVHRKKYQTLLAYALCSVVLLLGLLALTGYTHLYQGPRQERFSSAKAAYIRGEYIEVIDALAPFSIEELSQHQKVILARAYIMSQSIDSFRGVQREVILSRITYHGDSQVLEYWILLGRLDVHGAQNLAMLLDDHQLLLYAYIQELHLLERNQDLSGTERSNEMERVLGRISELASRLGIVYQEDDLLEAMEESSLEESAAEAESQEQNLDSGVGESEALEAQENDGETDTNGSDTQENSLEEGENTQTGEGVEDEG